MINTLMEHSRSIGFVVGFILVAFVALWFIPWVTLGAINRLFDISIQHSAINYFYFWVIKVFAIGVQVSETRSRG